jgi:hypothetical protein
MYEILVSRSLNDLGLDQEDFDSKVTERTGPEQEALQREISESRGGDEQWTIDERFLLASSFAKLAVWRIDPGSIEWARRRARSLFVLAHDGRWRLGVKVCICIFLVLVAFEPSRGSVAPRSGELGARPWLWWVALLEGIAAVGYVLDVCVHLGYQRWETIFQSVRARARAPGARPYTVSGEARASPRALGRAVRAHELAGLGEGAVKASRVARVRGGPWAHTPWARALQLTDCPAHGLPSGWLAAVRQDGCLGLGNWLVGSRRLASWA